jgi:predicted unusual protein kinase regulating ubiquinone biosynthesis (AarF/ABC1/UbiB family)
MTPGRAEKIARAVETGIERWPQISKSGAAAEAPSQAPPVTADVVQSMPRRKLVHKLDAAAVTLPMARRLTFRPGLFYPLLRLLVWMRVCLYFFCGNAIDLLLRRASIQRRAVRLRRLFEAAGGSFGKLAQQLAVRADLLPYAYCVELSKMLDQAPAFPTPDAIAIIELNLGRPLGEVFEIFDPEPIGSTSVACVYQAKLRSSELVAVKVRRPDIGRKLAADLRALDWLLISAEALTIMRAGLTRRFREELWKTMMGELNFRAEARYTEMFRLRARSYSDVITTQKVYFEYSTEQVLVKELASGVWMWELMAAVDQDDKEFLAKVAEVGIEPKSLASKLLRAVHHDVLEELFFHADPHPGNIVVLPNNGLCFIDFGAVGRFSTQTRNTWRELHYHLRNEDIGRMVNSLITLAGPLPPIDVDRFVKAIETIFADWVFAIKSSDAEWWERSSATNWLRYIGVAQEFGVPVALETIQFFRATVLYDSIVIRLNKDIDIAHEWKLYADSAGKAARKRTQKLVRKRLGGLTKMDYLRIEQAFDMASQFLFKVQRNADIPTVEFRNIAGKISYTMSLLLRLGYLGILGGGVAVIVNQIAERLFGYNIAWSSMIEAMMSYRLVQLILLIVAVVLVRRIIIRLNDPDTHH